jgi:hypothetical protein
MTFHEEMQMRVKCAELKKEGKQKEALDISKSIPMSPWLAEWWVKYVGADALRATGWNLSAAEAEFGTNWLARKN